MAGTREMAAAQSRQRPMKAARALREAAIAVSPDDPVLEPLLQVPAGPSVRLSAARGTRALEPLDRFEAFKPDHPEAPETFPSGL